MQISQKEELVQIVNNDYEELEQAMSEINEIHKEKEILPIIVYKGEGKKFEGINNLFQTYSVERIAMNDSDIGIYIKFSFDTKSTGYDYWGIYYSTTDEPVTWEKGEWEKKGEIYRQKGGYYEYETEKIKDNWYYYQCITR